MKEITKYVAYDGTVFDNDFECEQYELEKSKEKTIIFLDEDLNEIKITDYEDIPLFLDSEKFYFARVSSNEDVEYLEGIDENGYLPHYYGDSYWDDYNCSWESLDDKINSLLEELDRFKKAKEILDNLDKREEK